MKDPLVVAHRGGSWDVPENSLLAFEKSYKIGVDIIELDVHLTLDNVLIVQNKPYYEYNNQRKRVCDIPFDEIINNYKSNQKKLNRDNTIAPSFEQVMKWAIKRDIGLMIEIKNAPIEYPGIENRVIEIIEKYNYFRKTWIISFDHLIIYRLRKIGHRNLKVGIIYVAKLAYISELIEKLELNIVEPHIDFLTPEVISEIHSAGALVCNWSTNSRDDIKRLFLQGVDFLKTDFPNIAIDILNSK